MRRGGCEGEANGAVSPGRRAGLRSAWLAAGCGKRLGGQAAWRRRRGGVQGAAVASGSPPEFSSMWPSPASIQGTSRGRRRPARAMWGGGVERVRLRVPRASAHRACCRAVITLDESCKPKNASHRAGSGRVEGDGGRMRWCGPGKLGSGAQKGLARMWKRCKSIGRARHCTGRPAGCKRHAGLLATAARPGCGLQRDPPPPQAIRTLNCRRQARAARHPRHSRRHRPRNPAPALSVGRTDAVGRRSGVGGAEWGSGATFARRWSSGVSRGTRFEGLAPEKRPARPSESP